MSRPILLKLSLALIAAALLAGAGSYQIASTGADLTAAGEAFVGSLSPEQKKTAVLAYDEAKRTDWHYIPKPERKGLQVKDMTDAQRELAYKLLRAGLSQVGYNKARTIMAMESLLKELEKNRKGGNIRDPQRYFFTLFGTPAPQGQWGLSIEGHHLSLNFAVENGKLTSFTPCFFGANPHVIRDDYADAPKKGSMVLQQEEQIAFDLLAALDESQRKTAVIADKAFRDVRGGGEAQPPKEAPAGLPASAMNANARKLLSELINVYLGNLPNDLASAARKEIDAAGIDKVHFAWAGADKPGIGHYYRLQGDTFLVEYCNNQPDSAGNPANHSHAVWRDLRGDFAIHR